MSDALVQLRQGKGLSQADVARLVGVRHASQVSRWENGQARPGGRNFVRYAEVLGLSPQDLLAVIGEGGQRQGVSP